MEEVIEVSAGVTRNLGDYNNVRLDAMRRTQVKPGETPDEAYARAWAEVEAQVENKLAEYDED